MAPRKSSTDSGERGRGAELLAEVLAGLVSSVEGVQHALSPRAHTVLPALVYEQVRASITTGGAALGTALRLVGLDRSTTSLAESGPVQRVVGMANGAFAEHAPSRGGAVPAGMSVRVDRRRVALDRDSLRAAFPSASGRVVVFLHGLVETERSWFHRPQPDKARTGTDFGSRLGADLPCTPVYVRYNTGHRVSANGRELVGVLGELVAHWPVPVTEIVLIGHSMGGLVARSAAFQAGLQSAPWLTTVTRLVCLGTPHTGAPLERGVVQVAGLIDRFAMTGPLVRLLALRSDGIKDLARGSLLDEEQENVVALPPGARQLFVVATLSRSEGSLLGRLFGDLLVSPASAADRLQTADVEWLGGMHHFDLLSHDTVYDTLLDWLRTEPSAPERQGSGAGAVRV